MRNNTIVVPDVLGRKAPETLEMLFSLLQQSSSQTSNVLNLAPVSWIIPYGAVSLIGTCRYLKKLTGKPIRLTGLQTDIHAYLRRIDFFKYDPETIYTLDHFNPAHELSRSLSSTNVLELFPIRTHEDVYTVATRARHIFRYWLRHY